MTLQLRELTWKDLAAGVPTKPGPTSGKRTLGHPLPAEPCKGHDPIVLEDGRDLRDLKCGRWIECSVSRRIAR